MYQPHSKLDIEDLVNAVMTRQQLLQKQDHTEKTDCELNRLDLIKTDLQKHLDDTYPDDFRKRMWDNGILYTD